jgi:hypothetical protein
MEPAQSSETSAFNTQTPGKYPEDNLSLLQHGESLKLESNYYLYASLFSSILTANSSTMTHLTKH